MRVHFLPQYYNYDEVTGWLETQGIRQHSEEAHDDFMVTAQLMAANPSTVRMQQRLANGRLRISGITLTPAEAAEWGKKIIAFRAERTVQAIRAAIQR